MQMIYLFTYISHALVDSSINLYSVALFSRSHKYLLDINKTSLEVIVESESFKLKKLMIIDFQTSFIWSMIE